jgi:hypothetical protein
LDRGWTHWIAAGIWLGLFYEYVKDTYAGFGKGSDGISTPNNCLGVLSGIPSLAERFEYLNFRYLVAAFCRLGHPLRERLAGGAEHWSLHQRIF